MTTEMPKSLRHWQITREKGKMKFILQNGILAWGLPMFIVMTFVVNRGQGRPLTPLDLAINVAIWTICGAGFGWVVWTTSEQKYQKFMEQGERETKT